MQLPGILHLYLISTINNCVVIIGEEVGVDGGDGVTSLPGDGSVGQILRPHGLCSNTNYSVIQ